MNKLLFLLVVIIGALGWLIWSSKPEFSYVVPEASAPEEALVQQSPAGPPALPKTLTVDGVTYLGVRYLKHDAAGVSIDHDEGVARIPIGKLSEDLRAAFKYDPVAAAKVEAERAALAQQNAKRLADRRADEQARLRGESEKVSGDDIEQKRHATQSAEEIPAPPSEAVQVIKSGKLDSITVFGFAGLGMAFGLFWGVIGAFIGSFKNRKTLGLFLGMVLGVVGLLPLLFAKDGTREEGMSDMFMALFLSAAVNVFVVGAIWFQFAKPMLVRLAEDEQRAQAAHMRAISERY